MEGSIPAGVESLSRIEKSYQRRDCHFDTRSYTRISRVERIITTGGGIL